MRDNSGRSIARLDCSRKLKFNGAMLVNVINRRRLRAVCEVLVTYFKLAVNIKLCCFLSHYCPSRTNKLLRPCCPLSTRSPSTCALSLKRSSNATDEPTLNASTHSRRVISLFTILPTHDSDKCPESFGKRPHRPRAIRRGCEY